MALFWGGDLLKQALFTYLISGFLLFTAQASSHLSSKTNTTSTHPPLPAWQTEIFDSFLDLYRPTLERGQESLQIQVLWEEDSVVATIQSYPPVHEVILYGGLLRSPRLRPDSLRMVLCHEVGHLLGGHPRFDPRPQWKSPTLDSYIEDLLIFEELFPEGLELSPLSPLAGDRLQGLDKETNFSVEGQADYYASLVCFRRLIQFEEDGELDTDSLIDHPARTPRLVALCERAQRQRKDQLLCQRTALAGYELLQLVADFPISFETPDLRQTPRLIRNHYPPRQCRLDTYLAGALCSEFLDLDQRAASGSLCSQSLGQRPRCWYRETEPGDR